MIFSVIAFLVALLIGISVITFFLPKNVERPTAGRFVFYLSLSFGIGIGITSIMLFLYLHLFPIRYYPIVEIGFAALLMAVTFVLFRRDIITVWFVRRSEAMNYSEKVLAVIFFLTLAIVSFAFVTYFPAEPHEKWDAWTHWNSCARFIYYSDNFLANFLAYWETLAIGTTYPWLNPLSTARMWAYNGGINQIAPAMLNGLFALAIVGTAFGFFQIVKSRMTGWLAGAFLLWTPFLMFHALAQYADVPLAYYFLATVVTLYLAQNDTTIKKCMLPLTGVFAAFAGWTKNEGLLFMLFIFCALFSRLSKRREKKLSEIF